MYILIRILVCYTIFKKYIFSFFSGVYTYPTPKKPQEIVAKEGQFPYQVCYRLFFFFLIIIYLLNK